MKSVFRPLQIPLLIMTVSLLLMVVGLVLLASPKAAAHGDVNPVRGGQLYDKWWTVLATSEDGDHEHMEDEHGEHTHEGESPETDHPLWATQSTNSRSGADTWRCKECHGWDYKGADGAYGLGSHYTGFPGILDNAGKPPEVIVAILRGSTNPDHDFSSVMGDEDLEDLAAFISESLVDVDTLLNEDHTSAGDGSNGEILFNQVCTFCHGPEGNAINFGGLDDPEFIGHLATDNPWELIHKIRYGQPGWPMPSAIGNNWSDQDVADVVAYVEAFTTEPALSGGGLLYDKWWEVLGAEVPDSDQPLWSTQSTNTRSGADTWRCKECHGWDYRGLDGAYGSGSHATGFAGVLDASMMPADDVLAWLNGQNNPDHDFSSVMPDYAMNALVAFILEEATDISDFVAGDGTVNGDPRNGRDLYQGTCAFCHGLDGKTHNFGSEDEPEYIGTLAADNPWEFFHKASFGQPGVPMPFGKALGWSMQDIADVIAFAQTLPRE